MMDMSELKAAVFSVIDENDPYKVSRELHLKNWCMAFLTLFDLDVQKRLTFILDVLSDEECWEKTDTIHRIKLNRRTTARKIVQSESPTGIQNPLDELERYEIACWCCLEDDIVALFDYFRQHSHMRAKNKTQLRRLVMFLNRDCLSDPLTKYWSHKMGDFLSELGSSGKHLFEQGLDHSLDMYIGYVEGIEFFYDKIKALPEEEMCAEKKHEIFMNAAVRTAGTKFSKHPEIFEFCVSQITPDNYKELLDRDFHENKYFGSLAALQDNLRFDLFQKLFDCLSPEHMSDRKYRRFLTILDLDEYSDYYVKEASMLFMHIWMKEEFNKHRAYVLKKEMKDHNYRGTLLIPFVKKNFMEPVWAVLDKASPDELKIFMNCEKANYISSLLANRGDRDTLNKFLLYKSRAFENPSTSYITIDLRLLPTEAKKPRIE